MDLQDKISPFTDAQLFSALPKLLYPIFFMILNFSDDDFLNYFVHSGREK